MKEKLWSIFVALVGPHPTCKTCTRIAPLKKRLLIRSFRLNRSQKSEVERGISLSMFFSPLASVSLYRYSPHYPHKSGLQTRSNLPLSFHAPFLAALLIFMPRSPLPILISQTGLNTAARSTNYVSHDKIRERQRHRIAADRDGSHMQPRRGRVNNFPDETRHRDNLRC